MISTDRLPPAWKVNLIVFGLLILFVLSYFFWQVKQAHRLFLNHAGEYAGRIAGVIERNASGALLSQEIVIKIMQTFLGNTARFVDYLDMVEPFESEELKAFAAEAGLAVIRIIREDGTMTEGPAGLFPDAAPSCFEIVPTPERGNNFNRHDEGLQHRPEDHLYYLTHHRDDTAGCVIVGIQSGDIEQLQAQTSLSHVMRSLSRMRGIRDVRIEDQATDTDNPADGQADRKQPYRNQAGFSVNGALEVRVPFGPDTLVVALDTSLFQKRLRQLQYEYILFSVLLAVLGLFFSWLLHRYQTGYLKQVREFERELARQHEDAALGRSAASIAHEIRNPLNAIGMGLQRLQIEADGLDHEHRELITNILTAVHRTDGIVRKIQQYAKPLHIHPEPICPAAIVRHILNLYKTACDNQDIRVTCQIHYDGNIAGNKDLFAEAVENLIKNSVEAQPGGGFLTVSLTISGRNLHLSIENSGFDLSEQETALMFEPYFTNKTRGTGLGLAIAWRIIAAHRGEVAWKIPAKNVIRMTVQLPLENPLEEAP